MPAVALAEFEMQYTDALILMWRESFEFGVGVRDPHPLQAQREYFLRELQPNYELRIALQGSQLVGFIAASPQSICQLYVRVTHIGQGVGGHLLRWAKQNSEGALWLYTFARNHRARGFYESQGFRVVANGFEPMWQLEDIKYEWRREPTAT